MPTDFDFVEEAAPDAAAPFDFQPEDLSGIKLNPYQAAAVATGSRPPSGMESGTDLTAAVANQVVQHPFASAAGVVTAPLKAVGGAFATALNLVNPETWVPEEQKTDAVFGESAEERTARHAQEQFAVGQPLYTPTGSTMEPEGNELQRQLSQWSTPENIPLIAAAGGPKMAAAMLTLMVPGIIGDVKAIAEGEGTEDQKRDRINSLFAMGLMVAHGRAKPPGPSGVGRVAREAVGDVRGRLEARGQARALAQEEREAFAGRDWTADIDYDALSRDLAVPGARVMQRPSVVPPEGVVAPVGPMERIPEPQPPRATVPEGGEEAPPAPAPVPPREVGSYQDAVEILRARGNPQLTKAEIMAMFPGTIPNMEAAADLALETWGPQWKPGDQQRRLGRRPVGYPQMQQAVIAPPGPQPEAPAGPPASPSAPPGIPTPPKPPRAPRPAPPVPESQFPDLPAGKAGNRLVTIQRPDGSTYRAGASAPGVEWPKEVLEPGVTSGRTVHRVVISGDGKPVWSTGMLDPGEKIIDDAPAAGAAAPSAPTAPPLPKAGEPLIPVPKAPKPPEAQRRQIVAMLERLEDLDHKGEPYPKEGQEDRVKALRTRLAEIEKQLRAGKFKAPPPPPVKPTTPAPAPAAPAEPAAPAPSPAQSDIVKKLESEMDQALEWRNAMPQGSARWKKLDRAYRAAQARWSRAAHAAAPQPPAAPVPPKVATPPAVSTPPPVPPPAPTVPAAAATPPTPPPPAPPAPPPSAPPAPPAAPPAAPIGEIDRIKGEVTPLRPAGPEVQALRQKATLWESKLAELEKRMEDAQAKWHHLRDTTSIDNPVTREAQADYVQAARNHQKLKTALADLGGEIGIARMREETAQFRGQPQPEATRRITAKTLKTQKANLLQQVTAAIKEAPESGKEKITISVPGDGDFTIANTKETLKAFRTLAENQFPESAPSYSEPKLPSGKGKPIPKVEDPDPEDLLKLVGGFTSEDQSRFVLSNSYADGTQIVATDGRRLVRIVSDQAPGTPAAPVRLTAKGEVDPKAEGRYPNWKHVRDPNPALLLGGVDTGQLLHIVRQGQVFGRTSNPDVFPNLSLYVNRDKSLGGTMKMRGDEFSHNIQEGAHFLGGYSPDYLADALVLARKLGNERVDLYAHSDTDGPLGMVGKNHEALIMPMRTSEKGPIRDKAADFLSLAGRPEHGLLPEGYGPLTNPDDLISRAPEMGAAGDWRVEIEGGKLRVKQGKTVNENLFWTTVGEKPLEEWPTGAKAQETFVRSLIKEAPIPNNDARPVVAKHLRTAIADAVQERAELVEEVKKRQAPTGAVPGQVLGFGGASGAAHAPAPTTPAQLAQLIQRVTPGLGLTKRMKRAALLALLPSAQGPAQLRAAETLASKIGASNHRAESAATELRPFSWMFTRMGLEREGVDPANNAGLRFMSDVSQGRPLTGRLKEAADLIKRLFDHRLGRLEEAGAALHTIRQNYFPGMWTAESRRAFNAALQEVIRNGTIARDDDLNQATPQQRAAVKALVDQYLASGQGSDQDMLSYLSRRPLAGRESFRKEKVFDDIMDAAQFGLRPVSHNPVELVKLKLAEIDRSIMMHEYVQDLKGQGKLKVVNPYRGDPARLGEDE